MPAKTFTKTVIVPQRSADGNIQTDTGELDGKPLVKKEIGPVTFRVPTFQEKIDIACRKDRLFSQFENPERISIDTAYLIMARSHFPYQVHDAPEGTDWDDFTEEELRLLYEAYVKGKGEVEGTKNSSQ